MPQTKKKAWRLDEWNARFAKDDLKLIMMGQEEIREALEYLRDNNYPIPEDCPWETCPDFRPACRIGVCRIAVGMCGDF